ncbi:MAG: hypothetical protein LC715_03065, partial [Gammaproteobacteria bacterium]|nr:hypothetical protein [Gammaproteobacteria bacterium]
MSRLMLRLPVLLILAAHALAASAPASARTLQARIAKVTTAVATLEGVDVRIVWPAQATQGDLILTARRVDAPDLN